MLLIEETEVADVKVIKAVGGIDQEGSGILQDHLLALIGKPVRGMVGVVIDMREVPLVTSAGLRMLMIASKEYGKRQVKLVIAGLSPCVRAVFQISRFDKVIKTHDSVESALAALSSRAAAALGATKPA